MSMEELQAEAKQKPEEEKEELGEAEEERAHAKSAAAAAGEAGTGLEQADLQQEAEGCSSSGEHEDEKEAQFVDCPYSCGERVQRRDLEEHKSQHCPLRPFTCQYCNHEATYQDVTKDHWPVCEKYPLPCPNECGEEEIERRHLKGHLEQSCPLEVIGGAARPELTDSGTEVELQRRLMAAHMEESMEAHLSDLAREIPKLKDMLMQQANKIEEQAEKIKQWEKRSKQQEEHIRRQEHVLKMQMKALQLVSKGRNGLVTPTVDILVEDFKRHKKNDDQWWSSPFYSHVGGYKMCLRVDANGLGSGKGTHVSVFVYLMKGEFDDHLKWPFSGEVVVELKNSAKPPHFQMIITLDEKVSSECVRRPSEERNSKGWGKPHFISHVDLQGGGFLKDSSLVFCIRKVLVRSITQVNYVLVK